MSKLFSDTNVKQYFTDAYIDRFCQPDDPLNIIQNFRYMFPQLRPNERIETARAFFKLIFFIIDRKKLVFPSHTGKNTLYRAGKFNSGDRNNGFFPVDKSTASNCPTPGTSQEPIWFNFKEYFTYLNLSNTEQYGLISCRKMNDVCVEDGVQKFNLLLNLSSNQLMCNNTSTKLSLSLQEAINRVIIIPIVRRYSNKRYFYEDINYENCIQHADTILMDSTVPGYNCSDRYTGGTLRDVLNAWNSIEGTRQSIYNPDRIHIQVLFEIFELIELCINQKFNHIFTRDVTNYFNSGRDVKFNLLGWYCNDTPTPVCAAFPGEFAISKKYFTAARRFGIFQQRQEDCRPRFYRYSPNTPPNNIIEISETDAINANRINGGKNKENINNDVFNNLIRNADLHSSEATLRLLPTADGFVTDKNIDSNLQQFNNSKKENNYKIETKNKEDTDKPEDTNSDLFQLFFNFDSKEENKYTTQPKYIEEAIRKYMLKENDSIDDPMDGAIPKFLDKLIPKSMEGSSNKSRNNKSRRNKSRRNKSR